MPVQPSTDFTYQNTFHVLHKSGTGGLYMYTGNKAYFIGKQNGNE
jgi:hypothetical protein